MRLTVYLGTGGVGKTSVAAATALARARAGIKSLALTTDPARRLRTALGLKDGSLEQRIALDPPADGELWGALLDVRATLDEAVRLYADRARAARILAHPIYATIASSLAGMQELMAIERIDQLMRRGFENIVVDTAPSRHALEFLDKPAFLADLVDSTWVKLVGRTYRVAEKTGMMTIGRKAMDVFARVESILGAALARQILDFYSLFISIAEGYGARARKTVELLRNPAVTEFRVVTTPGRALRDARYFTAELGARNFPVGAFVVNRVWRHEPRAARRNGLAAELLEWYGSVRDSHLQAIARLESEYKGRIARVAVIGELERDVDGPEALERIAAQLD